MRINERYKHFLNFFANLITVLVQASMFAFMWYNCYQRDDIFFRRGNYAVIGLYVLILFFFTHTFGGYKVGYLRIIDISLSHVLAILCGGVIGYIEICMVTRDYSSIVPLLWMSGAQIVFVLTWTYIVRKLYDFLYPPRQVLVVYGEYSPENLITKVNTRKDSYNICSMISCFEEWDKLRAMIDEHNAILLCDLPGIIRNDIMKYCYSKSIRTYVTPKISDLMLRGADELHLFDTPLLLQRNYGLSITQALFKRIFDIIISLAGLIIAAPFMFVIAIAIKLYDGGPIFYKQLRLTKDEKEFMIYKFRSMSVDSEKAGARLAAKGDSRVTPVGKIIRNIHFDELPQLINILKGDMSLVGPRPERKVIAEQYLREIPEFHMRLKVKAGLTGYAQVYGRYNTTPYDKVKLDITYITKYSFWLDIKILLLTFKILFQKENTEGVDQDQMTAIKK